MSEAIMGDGEYEHTVQALGTLGFGTKSGIPTYHDVCNMFTPAEEDFLIAHEQNGQSAELVVAPSLHLTGLRNSLIGISPLGLLKSPVLRYFNGGLIGRYDENQPEDAQSVVEPPWTTFSSRDGHDGDCQEPWQVGILLNYKNDPRDTTQPANAAGMRGLIFTGMTADQQRRAIACEASKALKADVRSVTSARVGQLILSYAKQRMSYLSPPSGLVRLVQYRPHSYGGIPVVPQISAHPDGRLHFSASDGDNAYPNVGVRLAMNVYAH